MNILGITHPISWNPAACLLVDGDLIAFAEEERFVRLKHAPHIYPARAIEFCLDAAAMPPAQIDITAVGFERPGPSHFQAAKPERYLDKGLSDPQRFDFLTSLGLIHADAHMKTFGQRRYFDHHLCHAASATTPSGFESANVITLDGWGGQSSGLLGYFDATTGIRRLSDVEPYRSWGMTYELITDCLGFLCHSGEGKTMGLASYGRIDTDLLPDLCEPEFGLPDVQGYERYVSCHLERRKAKGPIEDWHRNLAATLQHYYERSLIRIARWLHRQTGNGRYVLAGGVALNCAANGKLSDCAFVHDIFVQPASHDGGTALGAAILAHHQANGAWPRAGFGHAYWGPSYTSRDVKAALDFARVRYEVCDGPATAAEALTRDEIVGWFQGAAEVGPRALGNRSILAHPGHASNLERVNRHVKRREAWRPLAPSVLAESYSDIFDSDHPSPFMLLATQVAASWRDRLPAIVHVDGSARPQAVCARVNPRFHRLISHFESRTQLPVVLNTSFNLNDEPLVNSPEHAIATFFRSGIETLVIGDYVVRKDCK